MRLAILKGTPEPSSTDSVFDAIKKNLLPKPQRVIITLQRLARVNEQFGQKLERCCWWVRDELGKEVRLVASDTQKDQLGKDFSIPVFASTNDAFWSFSGCTPEDRKRAEDAFEGLRQVLQPTVRQIEKETGKPIGQWLQEERDKNRVEEEGDEE
ncbi:MAG: hypothetical protein Q7S16_03540 [bacterium]|nr:hypothetical protein [bacterium]